MNGDELLGDLCAPRGLDTAPVLVAVHGGGRQVGDRPPTLSRSRAALARAAPQLARFLEAAL